MQFSLHVFHFYFASSRKDIYSDHVLHCACAAIPHTIFDLLFALNFSACSSSTTGTTICSNSSNISSSPPPKPPLPILPQAITHTTPLATHPRTSHTPDSPYTPVYASTTAHAATTDSTITARVPAPTTTTTTAHNSSSHSTRLQQRPPAPDLHPPHHHTSLLPSHHSKTLGAKLITIGTPTHCTATSSTAQYNLLNGHAKQVLLAFQPLTSSPGNSHTTARPSIQPAPSAMGSTPASSPPGVWPNPFLSHTSSRKSGRNAWTWTALPKPSPHHTRHRHPQQDHTSTGVPRPFNQPPHPATPIPLTSTGRRHCSTRTPQMSLPGQSPYPHATGSGAPSHPPTPPAHKPPVLADVLQPPHPDSWTNTDIQHWSPRGGQRSPTPTPNKQSHRARVEGSRHSLWPPARVNRLPIRSLQHLVSVGAAIGC